MKKIYFFLGILTITFSFSTYSQNCSTLEILTTTAGSVCGEGSVTLEATSSGTGDAIYWYDDAVNGNLVGIGSSFKTSELTNTTSYWATEVFLQQGPGTNPLPSPCTPVHGSSGCGSGDNIDDFVLSEAGGAGLISHLGSGCSLNAYGDYTGDPNLTATLFPNTTYNVAMTHTYATSQWVKIWIDFDADGTFDDATELVFQSTAGSSGGVTNGTFTIPSSVIGSTTIMRVSLRYGALPDNACTIGGTFGETHDYKVTIIGTSVLCESSPRVEVIATVNDVADEMVTEPLPFVHTANTSSYGNNYEGSSGSNCNASGGNYLNGDDVVYQYSPSVGGVYSIQLSGLSSNNAAVFVYESCYDIGSVCYAGVISGGGTANFGIAEVPMYDGFDYFIVVSTSSSPSTAYTLTIDLAVINCANYTTAPDGDEDQFFELGDTLADLVVFGGNLEWYSDPAGTNVLPIGTVLVDGATYYVNQTLNGCVSNLLAITVTEIDCTNLEILSTTPGTIVCKGSVVLEAVGNGGLGTEIYWYNTQSGGNLVGTGPTYTTPPLITTTSYWAAEVFLEQGSGNNILPTPCTPVHGSSGCGSGDNIDNFILSETGGAVLISHLGTGCSPNAYGDYTGDPNLTALLTANSNYDVSMTHTYQTSQWVKIWIDFDFDGTFDDTTELVFQSTSGSTGGVTNGTFNIPSNVIGSTTIMRVSLRYGALPDNACTIGGTFGETHDYKVTIVGSMALCESPRVEVIATVSQDGDITIPAALPYIDVNNNTSNYGNTYSGAPGTACGTSENYLNGNDVVYMYTPTMDDVIDIHLKDITGFYGGLFVYQSCGDIGTDCLAGVVAGPSEDDISIEEFTVLNGETYYIVVSSWLTSSINYTLEINGFVCAAFPAPIGDSLQDFVLGDTLADLEVEGTMSASVFTWYSDPAGTLVIPDTTPLVDGTTYYVSQTFGSCESPLLAILVEEIDCSNLDIVSTVDGSVVCLGTVTLEAVSSGTGTEIFWYDDAVAGERVGIGPTFTTPELTTTTSYWATEVYIEGQAPLSGQAKPAPIATENTTLSNYGLAFEATQPFTITSVDVYPNTTGGSVTVELRANDGVTVLETETVNVPPGNLTTPHTITLNFDIPSAGNYRLMKVGTTNLVREFAGAGGNAFPYPIGTIGQVNGGVFGTGTPNTTYYFFYNWTVSTGQVICESPREVAVATVNQTGDISVGPLPYIDQNNTVNYGNNFSGGSGCAGVSGNYLDGNDVVYQYSPVTDDIINIELSGVGSNTGVFVYESCGDVGGACLAGSVGNGKIEDFYVTGGQDYFIVIGSQSGSTAYTLDIYGFECANLIAPVGDSSQTYVAPATLADLDIDEYVHSTGLTWYSDAAGTQVIPDTTPLVDGVTYWVSQTVLGCESPLLEVTVNELDCTVLGIVSTTDGVVCQQGQVTLTATPSGAGSEVYWFASQTAVNPIAIGSQFVTPTITTTTSYWAAEVYLEQSTGGGGPLPSYCTSFGFGTGCSVGDDIEDFIIEDASGMTILSHLNSGCSPNAYGDFTNDANLMFTLVAGQTYNFTATHNFANQRLKIWIDFDKDGIFNNTNELLYESPAGANPTIGTFAVPNDAIGNTTVMRVFDRYASLPTNSCTSGGTWGEVHDYRVTVVGASILCESPRSEVIAEVNTTLPAAPVGAATQDFCGTDNTVGDIVITGSNIQWYDASGNSLANATVLVDGKTYYATQTVDACEGGTLGVVVTILNKSNKPLGDRNQPYEQGETLADLDVTGDNLLWYSDPLGNNPLPDTTLLVDQTTYYVTQTAVDLCESETLDIKVHRVLDVDDIAFANLQFYPNPARDYVTITNTGVIESVEVFSLLGQRVVQQRVDALTSKIDVTGLASGPYLLTIKIDGKTGIYKLIKK